MAREIERQAGDNISGFFYFQFFNRAYDIVSQWIILPI